MSHHFCGPGAAAGRPAAGVQSRPTTALAWPRSAVRASRRRRGSAVAGALVAAAGHPAAAGADSHRRAVASRHRSAACRGHASRDALGPGVRWERLRGRRAAALVRMQRSWPSLREWLPPGARVGTGSFGSPERGWAWKHTTRMPRKIFDKSKTCVVRAATRRCLRGHKPSVPGTQGPRPKTQSKSLEKPISATSTTTVPLRSTDSPQTRTSAPILK